ncbi:MAG: SCP2 sterol-binding domain-containing protein [Chloroflexi bacterium]|nr:SCP2 sterol-binding domain-containing protein [Chloroflexota bacterium]
MADELKELMTQMVSRFNPVAAQGVDAKFQLNATGTGGGVYTLAVAGGKATVLNGPAENPALVIDVAVDDWIAVMRGEMDATHAFMTGKLRVQGDMSQLLKFQQMFRP